MTRGFHITRSEKRRGKHSLYLMYSGILALAYTLPFIISSSHWVLFCPLSLSLLLILTRKHTRERVFFQCVSLCANSFTLLVQIAASRVNRGKQRILHNQKAVTHVKWNSLNNMHKCFMVHLFCLGRTEMNENVCSKWGQAIFSSCDQWQIEPVFSVIHQK